MRITRVEPIVINVNPRTNWTFVRVHTDAGLTGLGEATITGREAGLRAAIEDLGVRLAGRDPFEIEKNFVASPTAAGGRVEMAALSAAEQACWDIMGRALGQPVYRLLGGPCRERVRLYANLNRGVPERASQRFAEMAARAVADGFTAVKLAPFDHVQPAALQEPEGRRHLAAALERVARVREAIGPRVDLMVDCHWRFDARWAILVARELEPLRPYWFEDPLPDHDVEGLRQVRAGTSLRLAGGERLAGVAGFRPLIEHRLVDVPMPDVKYVGGIAETRKVAALAEAFGLIVSPHNPSGPIATIASLHVCAATRNAGWLEFPYGECDWRNDLVNGIERVEQGCLALSNSPGWGFELNADVVARHPEQSIVTLHQQLGLGRNE